MCGAGTRPRDRDKLSRMGGRPVRRRRPGITPAQHYRSELMARWKITDAGNPRWPAVSEYDMSTHGGEKLIRDRPDGSRALWPCSGEAGSMSAAITSVSVIRSMTSPWVRQNPIDTAHWTSAEPTRRTQATGRNCPISENKITRTRGFQSGRFLPKEVRLVEAGGGVARREDSDKEVTLTHDARESEGSANGPPIPRMGTVRMVKRTAPGRPKRARSRKAARSRRRLCSSGQVQSRTTLSWDLRDIGFFFEVCCNTPFFFLKVLSTLHSSCPGW